MKKILVIAVLGIASFANAQKGTILVAGNVAIDSWKQGDAKTSGFEFAPKVGYQFSDNMTVGIESLVGNSKDEAKVKTNDLKLGAFLRYAQPLAGVFSAYADLGAGMQSRKVADAKSNGFYIGLTPAVAIDLKKSLCLNFSIGGLSYDSMKAKGADDAANTFNFNFGKTFNVGISKNF